MRKKICGVLVLLTFMILPLAGQTELKLACAEGSASRAFIPLVKAIYAELKMDITVELVPAERALQGANTGTYDGDIARAEGSIAAYPNLIFTRESISSLELVPVIKKGSPITLAGVADVKKYKVGHVRGLKLAEKFCTDNGITADVVANFETLGRLLDFGRIDIALAVNPPPELTAAGHVLALKLMMARNFHVLHRKHAALGLKFDAVLKAMKEDGRAARILGQK